MNSIHENADVLGLFDSYEDDPVFDGEIERAERAATPANLTKWRWQLPNLPPDAERELLRKARAGDERANNELARRFHKLVLSIANEIGCRNFGPSRDDLIAAGLLGFAEALAAFDLRRNYRLASFVRPKIKFRMLDELRNWRRRGQSGATRADRYCYSHRNATAEEVSAKVGCSLEKAQQAIYRLEGYWFGHEFYDTTESREENVWRPAAFAHEWDALGKRFGVDAMPTQRTRPRNDRPSLVEHSAEEGDRLALRRLREVGRRAYALELVAHERALIAARSNPELYLYPYVLRERRKAERVLARRPKRRRRSNDVVPLMAAE